MLGMEEESSECSSGCESGWTMYLDQSIGKPTSLSSKDNVFPRKNGGFYRGKGGEEEGEEEDLSMISDASSGPPHFHEEDDYVLHENICFCIASSTALAKKNGKRRRVHSEEQHHPCYLDDTASSQDFSFSKSSFNLTNKQASMEDVLDYSIGFSATHFKEKSALQKHYSFLQKSLPGKPTS